MTTKYFVYILFSNALNKYYIGQSENVEERIKLHLQKTFPSAFTKIASDWEVFLVIPCNSRAHALQIEKHIKKMKSKVYIENLKNYPEMIEKLLLKYNNLKITS